MKLKIAWQNYARTALLCSLLSSIVFLPTALFGQSYQFDLIKDASSLGNNKYQITPNASNKEGAIWSKQKIDLTKPFNICFDANFGSKDNNGADGIAFVLRSDSLDTLGRDGGGLGFTDIPSGPRKISPSLAIEFDDFQNGWSNDPSYDHIALVKDGIAATPLTGPFQLLSGNIEDGVDHTIRIQWDPSSQFLSCWFDGTLKFSYNIDIATTIFSGTNHVYWGFTSGTGMYYNAHTVQFHSMNSFSTIGSASSLSNTCFQITPNSKNQKGAIWNTSMMDLNNDFTICFDANFGTKDANGADGMAFVLRQDTTDTLGGNGGGLGMSYIPPTTQIIAPSFAVEFDDFLNGWSNDPSYDHMALVKDGDLANPLDGPYQLLYGNIEDGQYHEVKITWDAGTQDFSVWFDGYLMTIYNIDLVNSVFGSNSMVWWGFTGATGNLFNEQTICNINQTCCGYEETEDCIVSQFDKFYDEPIGMDIPESAQFNSLKIAENCDFVAAGELPTGVMLPQFVSSKLPMIARTDKHGNPLWFKQYLANQEVIGSFENVIELSDQNISACGYYHNGLHEVALLVKTDAMGNELWTRQIGNHSGVSVRAWDVEETPHGLIAVSGTYGNDMFISVFDASGIQMWSKLYTIPQGSISSFALEPSDRDGDGVPAEGFAVCGNLFAPSIGTPTGFLLEFDLAGTPIPSTMHTSPEVVFLDLKQLDTDNDSLVDSLSWAVTGQHTASQHLVLGYFFPTGSIVKQYNFANTQLRGHALEQAPNGNVMVVADLVDPSWTYASILTLEADLSNNYVIAYNTSTNESNELVRSVEVVTNKFVAMAGGTDASKPAGEYNPLIKSFNFNHLTYCDYPIPLTTTILDTLDKPQVSSSHLPTDTLSNWVEEIIQQDHIYCTMLAMKQSTSLSTVEQELSDQPFIHVYPNPIKQGDILHIEMNDSDEDKRDLTVLDASGRVLLQQESETDNNGNVVLHTAGLEAGTYILQIKGQSTLQSIRFVVSH
ncbi:T9SS type A sorting domain-containing protein [bacterium SCSIO 12741]|nr:T9SS type A sorting domain-containing protein [bacterium SCSIO 12741]